MFRCPRCSGTLRRKPLPRGRIFECDGCAGRMVNMSVLRRLVHPKAVASFWGQVVDNMPDPIHLQCPSCKRGIPEVRLQRPDGEILRLDACRRCQVVWLDHGELERLPVAPKETMRLLPPGQREAYAIAMARRESLRSEPSAGEMLGKEAELFVPTVDQWWHLPAIFCWPVEEDEFPLSITAWITWGLILACIAVFALTYQAIPQVAETWGFIPAQFWRYGGLTLITSMFLHASLLHLFGNCYFLLIFGDNVEQDLGPARYILLYLAAGVFGSVVHSLFAPDPSVPSVGASGAISGVIAYYALKFPAIRIRFFLTSVPAVALFGVWVLFQIATVLQQFQGLSNVSGLAHLGGAAVGVAAWTAGRLLFLREMSAVHGQDGADA